MTVGLKKLINHLYIFILTTMKPVWYINESTGLVILKDGSIVAWDMYSKSVSEHELNLYLNVPCNCELCTRVTSRKRRASMNATEYHDYCLQ